MHNTKRYSRISMSNNDVTQKIKLHDVLEPWLSNAVEMRPSRIAGQGLFALRNIHPNEEIVRWGGTVFSRDEISAGLANPESIAIISEDLYLADPVGEPSPVDYSVNHCCDSNTWMTNALTLSARRKIEENEEITADYALWLFNVEWEIRRCNCGSPLCRRHISSQDWRLPDIQERYKGHFTPYINLLIMKESLF